MTIATYFNLSKVQLKAIGGVVEPKSMLNFNLSKVQLKGQSGTRRSGITLFQSLQGAIKSMKEYWGIR